MKRQIEEEVFIGFCEKEVIYLYHFNNEQENIVSIMLALISQLFMQSTLNK